MRLPRASLLLGMCALSCALAEAPSASGGVLLPGTHEVDGNSPDLSISPRGELLVYRLRSDTPDRPAYALYWLAKRLAKPIELSSKAAAVIDSSGAFSGRSIGWAPDQVSPVLISGNGRPLLVASPAEDAVEWRAADDLAYSQAGGRSVGRFRVDGSRTSHLRLVDLQDDGRLVAEHRSVRGNLVVEHLTMSPRGDAIAYCLASGRGFAAPTQGFIVELSLGSEPRLLGAPIAGGMAWDPTGDRVFAAARDIDRREVGIYWWNLTPGK